MSDTQIFSQLFGTQRGHIRGRGRVVSGSSSSSSSQSTGQSHPIGRVYTQTEVDAMFQAQQAQFQAQQAEFQAQQVQRQAQMQAQMQAQLQAQMESQMNTFLQSLRGQGYNFPQPPMPPPATISFPNNPNFRNPGATDEDTDDDES